ncbi:MAG: TGS domain-containing protein, partial [Flavobacteriaceae bacterium]|nr:TGS domain-containing protein [Flavobacteriaceae bacterium]
TLYIYAPLAHRIGLYNIKNELEDLGLKYTEPDVYNDIYDKIEETKEERSTYIEDFKNIIKTSLDKEDLKYTIKGRHKSIYSIRKKMLGNVSFDEIYDKFAIRIIYESDRKSEKFYAWKIYSIVTDHFRPNPIRLRDWISSPKSTGYEALHITVVGPKGKWVEVQIRSQRMDEIAEKGYAAHYKYKNGEETEIGIETWLKRLQETLENPSGSAVDFVEEFKLNLYAKEIFVFTPKGDLKSLPKGATPLDFAFSIHTNIGLTTRGARVNGKLVPLNHELKSGDQMEIITSPSQKPNANWLDYVITARARSKIKNALKEDNKNIAERGKELLERKLRHLKIKMDEKVVNELVMFFKLKTSFDLFYRVGIGTIENQKLKDFAAQKSNSFINYFKNKIRKTQIETVDTTQEEVSSNYDLIVFGKNEEKLNYKTANCCNPIPGDDVFGFVTVSEGIKVHKKDCPNAISMQSNYSYRIIQAKWIDSTQREFKATITITGIDNIGLVNDVTKVISSNMHVNMQSVSFESENGLFNGKVTVVVRNNSILKRLIEKLKKINGIDKVQRI